MSQRESHRVFLVHIFVFKGSENSQCLAFTDCKNFNFKANRKYIAFKNVAYGLIRSDDAFINDLKISVRK